MILYFPWIFDALTMQFQCNTAPKQKRDLSHLEDRLESFHNLMWFSKFDQDLGHGRNRKIESLSTGGQIFSTSYVAITSFSELEWAWICAYMAHFCLGWQRIIQTTRSHCFLPKFVKFNMYNYSIIILYFFQKTSIAQKILNFLNRPNIPILKNRFF